MTTRTGKIARLPRRLRDQLNFFIMDGKPAALILDWINKEPTAIEVFDALFGGRPVSPQNLSDWRHGGYQEWLAVREGLADASAFSENCDYIAHSGIRANHLLTYLTARWAKLIEQWGVMDATEFSRAKHNLADLTKSAAVIKKLELQTMRAELDRQRLKFLLKKKGQPDGYSDPEGVKDPQDNPYEYEPSPFTEKQKIIAGIFAHEAGEALKRLAKHPGALESEASALESPAPDSKRHPSAPDTGRPQTIENRNPMPTPPSDPAQPPEHNGNPVSPAVTTAASILPALVPKINLRNALVSEAPASSELTPLNSSHGILDLDLPEQFLSQAEAL